MSHDIRTPMNAILGFSTLIDREADNPAHVRDYNRKIATSGQHLLGLINDVLDMSKIEAGKTTLEASAFALSGTVESVEAMMRQQTDAKNQVFTVEVDKVEHDRLVGDEGRLRQILMNLLSNAMKYTPEGGHILFRVDGSAKRHGELQHLRIIVRDDGIGMSKDYLATIARSRASPTRFRERASAWPSRRTSSILREAPSPWKASWGRAAPSSSIWTSRRPATSRTAPRATAESEPATRAGPTGTPWRTSTSSWRRTTP